MSSGMCVKYSIFALYNYIMIVTNVLATLLLKARVRVTAATLAEGARTGHRDAHRPPPSMDDKLNPSHKRNSSISQRTFEINEIIDSIQSSLIHYNLAINLSAGQGTKTVCA